jgi:hypothetical protein
MNERVEADRVSALAARIARTSKWGSPRTAWLLLGDSSNAALRSPLLL